MHAVVNLNKPGEMTSRQAVTKVQKILRAGKAGHAGTLDPTATGLLIVCLGEATKIVSYLMDMEKGYRATICLGKRTDTYDAEGAVIETRDTSHVTEADIREAVEGFRGMIRQVPPMYSAVKLNGTPLYRFARRGVTVDRQARTVHIHAITIIDISLPFITVEVSCSKGTYIRTLAEDLGYRLGTGAHLSALERTRVGHFSLDGSVTLPELETQGTGGRGVFTVDQALAHIPALALGEDECLRARNGRRIMMNGPETGKTSGPVRMNDLHGNLFGIGMLSEGILTVNRILHLQHEKP